MSVSLATIPLRDIRPSRTNPRATLDAVALKELTDSVAKNGVLQPILVRPIGANGKPAPTAYEIVCGHRRFTAAKEAGLDSIPASIRELSDVEALELQLFENLQRVDLHPLEEAEGYQQLMAKSKCDVARIAERIGRSVAYVYDRLKLLSLTPEGKHHFLNGKITAGHAVLLARLSPRDQSRAMKRNALFQHERLLWDDESAKEHLKPVSVREFQEWIDRNVRFDAKEPDPILFPETAAALEGAPKIVPITFLSFIPESARDGRTWFPSSWKRADGKERSRTCDHAVTGFVAVGPRRGEAFPVCIAKEKCTVHWASKINAKKKRAAAKPEKPAKAKESSHEKRWAAERAKEQELQEQWKRARGDLLTMITKRVGAASWKSLAEIVLGELTENISRPTTRQLPIGRTPEDFIRHVAYLVLSVECESNWRQARNSFTRRAKALGVDVAAILKLHDAKKTGKAPAPVKT